MILRNYHNIDFILNFEIDDFIEQVVVLKKQQANQRDWEHWLTLRPIMTEDTYISFEDFAAIGEPQEESKEYSGAVYVDQVGF